MDRPAIVLLHGFTNTGASWDGVVAALGQRYRALTPDIRGHGAAHAARPIGFAECIADVVALEPGPFDLAGYSLGARLALNLALEHPERVARLVLVSGTAGIADDVEREARREADEALAADIEASSIEAFADRWGASPLFRRQAPEVAAAAREDRLRNTPAGLAAALRGLGTGVMPPLWGRLGDLSIPVTLIAGERDTKFRKLAERMAAAIAHSQLLIVPAAGHAVHLEAPRLVAGTLEDSRTGASKPS
jgi:2-succinyl-6-hydroxy-2,4-cyclohexadiene-1-carboxylate synthase